MKVVNESDSLIAAVDQANIRDVTFGKSREAIKMMLHVLTNSVYKDKAAAQWREYGCNAMDAHIEAGKPNLPIEITLPSSNSPEAVIRDFGPGVSPERMELYCTLGESTKRDSNEETGTYGMGAKAGFAYGDMFTVSSFIKGVKRIYQFFRENEMPRMAFVSESKTNSPDGTEVKIPVKRADISEFAIKAEKVFRYFKVTPVVHGGQLEYKRGHPTFRGSDWRITGDGVAVAIMGNVGYRIQSDLLGLGSGSHIESLLDFGLEIDVPIGELDIAPDREYLQYTDRVRKLLIAHCKRVVVELADVFKKEIAGAPDLWHAKLAYAEAFEKMGGEDKQTLRRIIDDAVSWNGKNIDSGRFYIAKEENDADTQITVYTRRNYGRRRMERNSAPEYIYPRANGLAMVLNDLPKLSMPQSRINGFFQDPKNETLCIFTFQNEEARRDYIKLRDMAGVPFIKFSSIAPFHYAGDGTSGPSQHRAKHTARAFTLDESQTGSSRYGARGARSLWWKVEKIDTENGTGVYVELSKFHAVHPIAGRGTMEPSDLLDDVQALKAHGFLKGKVYGFKAGSKVLKKLGKGWQPLKDVMNALGESLTKAHGQELADYIESTDTASLLPLAIKPMLPSGIAADSIEIWQQMNEPTGITKKQADYLRDGHGKPWLSLGRLPEPSFDLADNHKDLLVAYPMLNAVQYWGNDKKALTVIADYIKMVDTVNAEQKEKK